MKYCSTPPAIWSWSAGGRCRWTRSRRSSRRRSTATSGTTTADSSPTGSRSPRPASSRRSSGAGQGSILRDLLGREYIDCLGGYGIFSAGINHPTIVKAVTDQLGRMALNSQELLEPWRAALARVLAEVTPGDLQNSFFINNGTDAIEGAIKLARLYTKRAHFHLHPRRLPRQVDGLALAHGQGVVPGAVPERAAGRPLRALRRRHRARGRARALRRGRYPCGRRGAGAGAG